MSGYTAVIALKVGAINWKIDGRCTRKTKLIPYESRGKRGLRQNYDFEDHSGKIQAVAFNEIAKQYDRVIEVGKRYEISKASVNKAFGAGCAGYHDCELMLYGHSNVEMLEEKTGFVKSTIEYRRLVDVANGVVEANANINVIAVVGSVGCLEHKQFVNADGTKRETDILEIELVDNSVGEKIPVTFWGPAAHDMTGQVGKIVDLKGLVVENREGRVGLKANSRSEYVFDSTLPAAVELGTWYAEEKMKRSS